MTTIKTEIGIEQYWSTEGLTRNAGCIVYGYGFLMSDGELFQCVKPALEACRAERDEWLKGGGTIMDLREVIFDGETYYYYPDDIYYSDAGNKCAPAQDDNGNEFTIVWNETGRIRNVDEIN